MLGKHGKPHLLQVKHKKLMHLLKHTELSEYYALVDILPSVTLSTLYNRAFMKNHRWTSGVVPTANIPTLQTLKNRCEPAGLAVIARYAREQSLHNLRLSNMLKNHISSHNKLDLKVLINWQ